MSVKSEDQPPIPGDKERAFKLLSLAVALSGCIVLIATGFAAFHVVLPTLQKNAEGEVWVARRYQALSAIQQVLGAADDAETGQRGFLLTHNINFLQTYDKAIERIGPQFEALNDLVRNDPTQQARLSLLRSKTENKLAVLSRVIKLAKDGDFDAALDIAQSDASKATMAGSREAAADMADEEHRQLRGRQIDREASERRLSQIALVIAIAATVSVLGIFLSFFLMILAMASQRRASGISSEAQEKLARANVELTLSKQQADQANQAKSRFLAAITHELRTPLHGILGYAELLTLEGDLNSTQSQRLEVMIASGEHLLASINAVLDVSQIDANQLELHPADIDLSGLVETCLNVVRPAAEAKGLMLSFAPFGPLRVVADATRVRQVLINLLGNAVKFTPDGSVTVRLHHPDAGACVRLEVADTGPGIWLRHREKLFRDFERLNTTAVSGIEGAGLGLGISARLVKLMGGDIGYLDNPTGGSVFWFELPELAPDPSTAEITGPVERPSGRRLRVLVADDEALNRSIASNFLTMAGHDVVCVEDGAKAVEAASTDDFDVVLMDVRMPVLNGMEATRQIRSLPPPRGMVHVIAVTAQAFKQQIELCKQAGMDGHVSKPFKQAVLLAALQGVAEPVAQAAESEFPIFDRAMFEDATNCLAQAELQEHLLTLEMRCEALLHRLRAPGMLAQARALTEDAHRLAGGAGTFGFLSASAAARDFEAAAEVDAAETDALADRLAVAIETSMTSIRSERAALTAAAI